MLPLTNEIENNSAANKLLYYILTILTLQLFSVFLSLKGEGSYLDVNLRENNMTLIFLVISYISIFYSSVPVSHEYSYGNQRFEIIASFIKSIYLFYKVFHMCTHVIISNTTNNENNSTNIVYIVPCTELFIHFFGMLLFLSYKNYNYDHNNLNLFGFSDYTHYKQAHYYIMNSCFIYAYANFIFSSFNFISLYYINSFSNFDIILCNICVSIFIIWITIPIFTKTKDILLQKIPDDELSVLNKCIDRINSIEGVLECKKIHLWKMSSNKNVGSMHIRVRKETDEESVLKEAHKTCDSFINNLTLQIDKSCI